MRTSESYITHQFDNFRGCFLTKSRSFIWLSQKGRLCAIYHLTLTLIARTSAGVVAKKFCSEYKRNRHLKQKIFPLPMKGRQQIWRQRHLTSFGISCASYHRRYNIHVTPGIRTKWVVEWGVSYMHYLVYHDFCRCDLLWYWLPSAAIVDADALVPHRYQSISTSRFICFTNDQWFIYTMYVPRHR